MDAVGGRRAVIEAVGPEVDGGRFPIKRTTGEPVIVEADNRPDWVSIPVEGILRLLSEKD